MGASLHGRVRWWRWRRNPLRRRSDIAEAWVLLASWVAALAGGLLVGPAAADAIRQSAERQRTERREVSAVLVEDADDRLPERAPSGYRVWATVRWTAPEGSAHTDEARVPSGTPAGHTVTVWVDRNSKIAAEPLTDEETRWRAISVGALIASGASGAVLAVGWVARQGLERHRMARWAAEWERMNTQRGGKTGSP
ncbi:Rv1733c family protein [Streptomyces massasporeus]